MHSIESQNSVKRISLDISSPSSSTQAVIIDERRLLEHDANSAAEVEARIAKKVALLDQPVREFTTKPGNPQVHTFSLPKVICFLTIYLCLAFQRVSCVSLRTVLFFVFETTIIRFIKFITYGNFISSFE